MACINFGVLGFYVRDRISKSHPRNSKKLLITRSKLDLVPMGIASRYMDWMGEAEDDFETAKYLLAGGRYSKTCFHAQQAAGKAAKALLIRRCGRYEDVHSVVSLLQVAGGSMEISEELMAAGNRLDRHYIPPRYPNAWPAGAERLVCGAESITGCSSVLDVG